MSAVESAPRASMPGLKSFVAKRMLQLDMRDLAPGIASLSLSHLDTLAEILVENAPQQARDLVEAMFPSLCQESQTIASLGPSQSKESFYCKGAEDETDNETNDKHHLAENDANEDDGNETGYDDNNDNDDDESDNGEDKSVIVSNTLKSNDSHQQGIHNPDCQLLPSQC